MEQFLKLLAIIWLNFCKWFLIKFHIILSFNILSIHEMLSFHPVLLSIKSQHLFHLLLLVFPMQPFCLLFVVHFFSYFAGQKINFNYGCLNKVTEIWRTFLIQFFWSHGLFYLGLSVISNLGCNELICSVPLRFVVSKL